MDASHFAKLSAELRNYIYHLTLQERHPVAISTNFIAEAALLRTCKQIRQEAELIFYAQNHFTAVVWNLQLESLHNWLRHGPTQKLKFIKSLTVRLEMPGFDFVKAEEDIQPPDPADGVRRSLVADADHPAISTFTGVSFGDRRLEGVVRFVVNGAADDVSYRQAIRRPRAQFKKHSFAEFMMLLAAYGGSCIDDALGESRMDGFLKLEDRLHEGIKARI